MNYGSPKQSTWSKCNNFDFLHYCRGTVKKRGSFCLTETYKSCSRHIFLSLKGRPFDKQGGLSGLYTQTTAKSNTYWVHSHGDYVIWFNSELDRWHISSSANMGTQTKYTASKKASACPESLENEWYYWNSHNTVAGNQDISLQEWSANETCKEDLLFLTLSGQSHVKQNDSGGFYQRIANGSLIYWVQQLPSTSTRQPKEILFNGFYGSWMVDGAGIESLSSPVCPYESYTKWEFYNGNDEWIEDAPALRLVKWTQGR